MKLFRKCLIYFYSVLLLLTFSNASFADLPTLDAIQAQLNTAKVRIKMIPIIRFYSKI